MEGELGERQVFPALPARCGGDFFGDVQAAIGGEALEHDVFEGQLQSVGSVSGSCVFVLSRGGSRGRKAADCTYIVVVTTGA